MSPIVGIIFVMYWLGVGKIFVIFLVDGMPLSLGLTLGFSDCDILGRKILLRLNGMENFRYGKSGDAVAITKKWVAFRKPYCLFEMNRCCIKI